MLKSVSLIPKEVRESRLRGWRMLTGGRTERARLSTWGSSTVWRL